MRNRANRLLMLAVACLLVLSGTVLAQEQTDKQGTQAPDNTGVNKRDRRDQSMTADKQGQSGSDVELTRKIRRAIMEDDSLSSYAKNIKIITRGGMVTLRGPVHSDQEKAAIEAKAVSAAGEGKVANKLEVKPAKQHSKRE